MNFFLSFQLLGHLLIVAKNVAAQESLNEGYRVGKKPTFVANNNPPAVNFVHTEFTSFCPLQWLMMENTVLSQFTTFMSTCWEDDSWHGLLDNSDAANMSALMCFPFEHMMNNNHALSQTLESTFMDKNAAMWILAYVPF